MVTESCQKSRLTNSHLGSFFNFCREREIIFFPQCTYRKMQRTKNCEIVSPLCAGMQALYRNPVLFLQCRKNVVILWPKWLYSTIFDTSFILTVIFLMISSDIFKWLFQTFAFKKAVKICRTSTLKNGVNLIWRGPTSLPIFIPSLETHGFIKRNNYMFIPEREIEKGLLN